MEIERSQVLTRRTVACSEITTIMAYFFSMWVPYHQCTGLPRGNNRDLLLHRPHTLGVNGWAHTRSSQETETLNFYFVFCEQVKQDIMIWCSTCAYNMRHYMPCNKPFIGKHCTYAEKDHALWVPIVRNISLCNKQ